MEAYPNAAKQGNDQGELPLHRAVDKEVDVVLALLEAYPEAAKQADVDGYLPLYLAVVHSSGDVVLALLDAYPDAAKQATDRGELPLHKAVGHIAQSMSCLLCWKLIQMLSNKQMLLASCRCT